MPALAVASLDVLARRQATVDDPWADAEPGKILHELRAGEMARAGETPHAAYYGSVDSTPLWLILLGETHAWTGDDALVDRLWPNALAALDWIDHYGDLDGDGFVEYQRRSPRGLLNQGWKDSGDAIRHIDGVLAEGPIALVEVQGYVYAARRAMARLARHRGDRRSSPTGSMPPPTTCARPVRRGLLDAGSRASMRWRSMGRSDQVGTIGSNVGQALWTGIVPPVRAMIVADRLIEPDLFSGWGIRTYASRPAGLQPRRLSHRLDLAARQRDDGGRAQAESVRLTRRTSWPGGSSRRPSGSPTSACPSCSAGSVARTSALPSPTRSPVRRRPGRRPRRSS